VEQIGKNMQKIFITDIDGILGQAIVDLLILNSDVELFGIGFRSKVLENVYKLDRSNIKELKAAIYEVKPDYIVNTYTNFDAVEAFADKNSSMDRNVKFTDNICRIAAVIEAKIIAFSDFNVFSSSSKIYEENSPQDPQTYLGKTLHMLENTLKISSVPYTLFRLGFLIGYDDFDMKNDFYNKSLHYLLKHGSLEVPKGALQPVFANDVASAVEYAIENDVFDIFNLCGNAVLSFKSLFEEVAALYMLKMPKIEEKKNKNFAENVEMLNLKSKTFFNIDFAEYNDIINFIKFQNN
jgi:dTDP-4-dehydrorhamnose reductase